MALLSAKGSEVSMNRQQVSLISFFAYDLSQSAACANREKIKLLISELHKITESASTLIKADQDSKGVTSLIGCLCELLLKNDLSLNRQEFEKCCILLKRVILHNISNVDYVFQVLPGMLSCLYKVIFILNNPILLSQRCFSTLVGLFCELAVVSCSSLRLEGSFARNFENAFFGFILRLANPNISSCLTQELNQRVANDLALMLLNWKQTVCLLGHFFTFCNRIDSTKVRRRLFLPLSQDSKVNALLCSVSSNDCIGEECKLNALIVLQKHEKALEFILNSSKMGNFTFESKKLMTIGFEEDKLHCKPKDFFSISPSFEKIVQLVPFSNFADLFYERIIQEPNEPKYHVLLASYSGKMSNQQLTPFIQVILEHEFLCCTERRIVICDLLLVISFIEKHSNPQELTCSLLFPLIEQAFNQDREISFLSSCALHALSRANGLKSCSQLITQNKDSLFGSLSLNFHYKSDELERNCAILLNIIKLIKSECVGLIEDSILFLSNTLRNTSFSEVKCCCILSVFDEFFKVYSANLSAKSDRPTFIQQTALDLLRTAKHLLSKDNSKLLYFALRMFQSSLPYIAAIEKEFLPLVHEIWSFIMHRLMDGLRAKEREGICIAENALQLIGLMAKYCGDFVRQRIGKEVLPHLHLCVGRLDLVVLFECLQSIVANIEELSKENVLQIMLLILPQIERLEAAQNVLNALRSKYPAVMWFYLNQYSKNSTFYCNNKNSTFKSLDFTAFKRLESKYSLEKYTSIYSSLPSL